MMAVCSDAIITKSLLEALTDPVDNLSLPIDAYSFLTISIRITKMCLRIYKLPKFMIIE